MNRRHTARDYLALIERIRAARPDIALSTDVIAGFPGESEAEFSATLAMLERVGFAQAYSFKYSPRPGTPAAETEQLPDAVRDDRLPVLLERPGRHVGQLIGRSPYMQAVHVEADASSLGHVLEVEIRAARANSLAGRLTSAATA
jgi:tRNA-2-methylthio-N6-dimethylallyladenosine synthase